MGKQDRKPIGLASEISYFKENSFIFDFHDGGILIGMLNEDADLLSNGTKIMKEGKTQAFF